MLLRRTCLVDVAQEFLKPGILSMDYQKYKSQTVENKFNSNLAEVYISYSRLLNFFNFKYDSQKDRQMKQYCRAFMPILCYSANGNQTTYGVYSSFFMCVYRMLILYPTNTTNTTITFFLDLELSQRLLSLLLQNTVFSWQLFIAVNQWAGF